MTADAKHFPQKKLPRWMYHPVATACALIVLLVVLLRIPSFVEPYWYGDEGIYLTIGNALNSGAVLYKDIVDHKTPLIYYFARAGSQLNFRLLMTAWMVVASLSLFAVLYRLTKRVWLAGISAGVFVVATSVPYLEGNIPNGELFVMGFVLAGLAVFVQTKSGYALFHETAHSDTKILPERNELWRWLLGGALMGGAILTKVPALFDALSLFFIIWLVGWDRQVASGWRPRRAIWQVTVKQWGILAIGLAIPILISILYFVTIGAGKEYLEFGVLYNFHYVQNWSLEYLPKWGQFLYTFPIKALILVFTLLRLTVMRKILSRPVRWSSGWFYLALFASTLSNRPYPHYLLQVVPPLVLLLGLVWHDVTRTLPQRISIVSRLASLGVATASVFMLWLIWFTLRIGHYPLQPYYQSYLDLARGKISAIQYRDSFNAYMPDNYAASAILQTSSDPKIFIWGTNPMLYALSGKQPVGRFTVSFHIKDLNVYAETMDAVKAERPEYIVVMKNEDTPLPGLMTLLQAEYTPRHSFEYFTIWKRQLYPTSSLQLPRE